MDANLTIASELFTTFMPHIPNRHDRKTVEDNKRFCDDPEVYDAFWDRVRDEETDFLFKHGLMDESNRLFEATEAAEDALPCRRFNSETNEYEEGKCPFGHEKKPLSHIDCATKCECWKRIDDAQKAERDWRDKNLPHYCRDCKFFCLAEIGRCKKTDEFVPYYQKSCRFFMSLTEHEQDKERGLGPWSSGKPDANAVTEKRSYLDSEYYKKQELVRQKKLAERIRECPHEFYHRELHGFEHDKSAISGQVAFYQKNYYDKAPDIFKDCLPLVEIVRLGKLLGPFEYDREKYHSFFASGFPLKFGHLERYAIQGEGKFVRRTIYSRSRHFNYKENEYRNYILAECMNDADARFLVDVSYGIRHDNEPNIVFPLCIKEMSYEEDTRWFVCSNDADIGSGKFHFETANKEIADAIIDLFHATFWMDDDFSKAKPEYAKRIRAVRDLQAFWREHFRENQ